MTTFEVLVTVAVVGALAAFGIGGYLQASRRASLASQTDMLATAIRQAQSNAQTSQLGRSWGIRCVGPAWERFSVVSGVTETDSRQQLQGAVRCSGAFEVQFAKLTGRPSNNVDFIVTDDVTYKRVTVLSTGLIVTQ